MHKKPPLLNTSKSPFSKVNKKKGGKTHTLNAFLHQCFKVLLDAFLRALHVLETMRSTFIHGQCVRNDSFLSVIKPSDNAFFFHTL